MEISFGDHLKDRAESGQRQPALGPTVPREKLQPGVWKNVGRGFHCVPGGGRKCPQDSMPPDVFASRREHPAKLRVGFKVLLKCCIPGRLF